MTIPPDLPESLRPLAALVGAVRAEDLSRFLPSAAGGRQSAVLILFGEGPDGPDVVLTQRGVTLRDHPGQPAFPGGAVDPSDGGPAGTALREAREEIGADPAGIVVLGALPSLYLPPSGYVVTPVLAWERTPSPLRVVDPVEVAAVHRVPLAELLDPANRLRVRHPNGYFGPAFRVRGMTVWGFTGGLLDRLLRLAGLERPWNVDHVETVPAAVQPPLPGATRSGGAA